MPSGPSLMILLPVGVSWAALQALRVGLYLTHSAYVNHPLLDPVSSVLGVTFVLSTMAVIVSRATRRILAALARSESDRDQIFAGLHDRIDDTAAAQLGALDRSMNWVLKRLDS